MANLVCQFGEARIGVETNSEQLFNPLREYLQEHLVEGDCYDAEFKLELKKVLCPIPTHARLVIRYFALKIFYLKGITYFTDFRSYLMLGPDGKRAQGFISPETFEENGIHFFIHTFFSLALFELLRHYGLFFLHSAGLISPEGTIYLFPASGGEGKSTLTVYLLREGYHFLSDDVVFLMKDSGELAVLGFKKLSHISEPILDRLPELSKFKNAPSLDGKGKRVVDLTQVYPGQRRDQISGKYVIIFPKRIAEHKSGIKPLSKMEAFNLLISQTPLTFLTPELAPSHLQTIRSLLSRSQVWLLESGDDWLDNPQILKKLLSEAEGRSGKE